MSNSIYLQTQGVFDNLWGYLIVDQQKGHCAALGSVGACCCLGRLCFYGQEITYDIEGLDMEVRKSLKLAWKSDLAIFLA